MSNKYELTKETKEFMGSKLFQIRALKNIERFGISKRSLQ